MLNAQTYTISSHTWENAPKEIAAIRRAVFIEEQAVPETEEWDEHDQENTSQHYLISDEHNIAVGTLRLVQFGEDMKLTRLAILKPYRRKGFASALIQKALHESVLLKAKSVFLHAQTDAIGLYEKFACKAEGEVFNEAGIDHILMRCELSNAEAIQRVMGKRVFRIKTSKDFRRHLKLMCETGSRKLLISSTALREDIYGEDDCIDALSQFARNDRNASIRILIHNKQKLTRRSQRIIDLARRLPSKISLKILLPEQELESFISLDKKQLIYFNDEKQLNGFYCHEAAPECKNLAEQFEHAWTHTSATDPNFSQLNL